MLFRLSLTVALSCFLSFSASAPVRRRDVRFESLYGLTKISKDHSGRGGDNPQKYFHESVFHPHYDGRFSEKPLPNEDRLSHLQALVQTYLSTMHDIGAETWIMHGSLMGWWWNRRIMPWDSDIDVQISERGMKFLADYYNMTVHHFKLPGIKEGRKYLLEVNPNYSNGSSDDWMNVIDARWIDTDSGLFIDITTLRRDLEAEARGEKGKMRCKDKHKYLEKQIFPLRDGTFEGMPVKIPYAYAELLEEEYGRQSLTNKNFEKHHFDEQVMEWIPDNKGTPTKGPGH